MRSRDEIREEVIEQLGRGAQNEPAYPVRVAREIDRRYHCERIIEEAEAYEREHGRVRIEFVAVPDDHLCEQCRVLGGKSVSLEDFRKNTHAFSCRCAVVFPEDDEQNQDE